MLRPAARLKIISRVKTIVLKRHFNIGNVDYLDWSRVVDEQTPSLIMADDNIFEIGVRNLLARLNSSHTNFYSSDTNSTLPQHVIGATFRSVMGTSGPQWMFLDVFDESPASLAGISPGYRLISIDGTLAMPPALPYFRFGQGHELTIQPPGRHETRRVVVSVPLRIAKRGHPPLVEPRSISYRILESQVGLLKIAFFPGAFGIRFSGMLDAAIRSLKEEGCDRLIIDLRGCLGGSLGFARLVSYLSPDRIPIGYDVTRKRLQGGYDLELLPRVVMPSTNLGLVFCLLRFSAKDKSLVLLTQGLGRQPFHGRVVVLINEWTNSAGEIVAQFAKDTKLATLVGEPTRGNLLGATTFDVGNGYKIYLPVFGWYGMNGKHMEGSGVEADVPIDIDPDNLSYANDAQINKALEILR